MSSLFSYSNTTLFSPYLFAHAFADQAILVLGLQTGTTYQTNLPTWNIELGYGLKELQSKRIPAWIDGTVSSPKPT